MCGKRKSTTFHILAALQSHNVKQNMPFSTLRGPKNVPIWIDTVYSTYNRWHKYELTKQLPVTCGRRYSTSSQCNQPENLQDQSLVNRPNRKNSRYSIATLLMAVTRVFRQPDRTMENSLTRGWSLYKMSSLSFTLIYQFTRLMLFSLCRAKASISHLSHLEYF